MKRLFLLACLGLSALALPATTCTFSDNYVECTDGVGCTLSQGQYYSCTNGVSCTLSGNTLDCSNGNDCFIEDPYWSCTHASCTKSGNYLDCTNATPFSSVP